MYGDRYSLDIVVIISQYMNIKSLCCTPETNVICQLYLNFKTLFL